MLLQRNRVGVISAGVAMGAIALGVTPGIAHADPYVPVGGRTHFVGTKITVGAHWIGGYTLRDQATGKTSLFYCGDPERMGPSSGGGYHGKSATQWRTDTGALLDQKHVSQIAYVLGKWGQTTSNKQASAVDAAVYALQGKSDYQLHPSTLGWKRAQQAGVTSRAQSMITEAGRYATGSAWRLSVSVPKSVTPGSTVQATASVRTRTGRGVPGVAVTLRDQATGKTVKVTTSTNGTAVAHFATGSSAPNVHASASVPATTLRYWAPSKSGAQRILMSGLTMGLSASAHSTFPAPNLKTTALDKADGDHMVVAKGGTIVDTVAYHDAIPGKPYKVVGEMMDQVTGKPTGIKASAKFTAKAESGTAKVVFTVPTGYAGRKLVAFETLYDGAKIVAEHKDIHDHSQTVWVPKVATNAVDKADNDHVLPAEGGTIVDVARYWDVEPGKDYVVAGELMDRATGKPTGIKASAKFTAKAESGTAKVVFTVPTGYAGKDLVAFETISMGGKIVGSHQDINDHSQTVSVSKPTPTPTPTPIPTPTPAAVAPKPTPTPTLAPSGGVQTGDVPGGPVVGWIAGGVALIAFAGGAYAMVVGGRRHDTHGE